MANDIIRKIKFNIDLRFQELCMCKQEYKSDSYTEFLGFLDCASIANAITKDDWIYLHDSALEVLFD